MEQRTGRLPAILKAATASPPKLRELSAPIFDRIGGGRESICATGHCFDDFGSKLRGDTPSVTANRALRMRKDQLQVGHTIHPSDSGRQASERHPYCHRESAAAYLQPNLAAREPVERQRRLVCVSETSSSSPSIEAQLILAACRRSCDRACGASRFGSSLSKPTWQPSWPWPPRERRRLSPARASWRTTSVPGLPVWSRASPAVSPSAFLGACSLRNFRQIDIDVL